MPISWKVTLQQYVAGCILSTTTTIREVYDYVDRYVPMLARMYERRLRSYSTIGYAVKMGRHRPMRPKLYRARNGVRLLGYSSTACHFFCNYLFALGCEVVSRPEPDDAHSTAI
jgi:hypothetical protein